MTPRLLCFGLVLWAAGDQLLWIASGFAAAVSAPWVIGTTAFRGVILGCALSGRKRRGCIGLGWRLISLYAFGVGGLVSTASAQAAGGANLCGLWRVQAAPPLAAWGVAAACVGYLIACSLILPRTRNLY